MSNYATQCLVQETLAGFEGLAAGGFFDDVGAVPACPDADVVAMVLIGDALRLNVDVPPLARRWMRQVAPGRVRSVMAAMAATLAFYGVPGAISRADGTDFAVVMRDQAESVRLAAVRAAHDWGWTPADLPAFRQYGGMLADFDAALRAGYTRDMVRAAVGNRAPMAGAGWWAATFPT